MAYIPNATIRPRRNWFSQLLTAKYSPYHTSRYFDYQKASTWRPWPLRARFFISFVILCISLSITIELIVRGCHPDGCRVFGAMSPTEVSRKTYFAYQLAPVVMSVGLGALWNVSHHDIMRLEPFFQMSVKGGATAVDSLFLEYSYTFGLLVPYEAGKRSSAMCLHVFQTSVNYESNDQRLTDRHYVVLLSSCILLLMNFLVTPLITGIFDDTTLEELVPGTAIRRALYTGDLGPHTTSGFTNLAYAYSWLGSSLPPFTTPAYALLPVNAPVTVVGNETWSAGTTLFGAELTCERAILDITYNLKLGKQMGTVNFTSQSGNDSLYILLAGSNEKLSIVSPWTSITGYSENSTAFFIGWVQGNLTLPPSPRPVNSTALLCNSLFYSYPVTATFAPLSGQVLNVSSTGERTPFTDLGSFRAAVAGTTNIPPQYIDNSTGTFGLGFIPPMTPDIASVMHRQLGALPQSAQDVLHGALHDQINTESLSSVFFVGTQEVAALAMHNRTFDTLEELLDPKILADSYQSAFQLLFAFWIATEVMDVHAADLVTTTRRVWSRGFAVNQLWARGAQGGLAVVAVMAISLGVLIRRRRCELDGEPYSLVEGLRLLSWSPDLSAEMENAEFNEPKAIMKALTNDGKRYTLELILGKGPTIRVVNLAQETQLGDRVQDSDDSEEGPILNSLTQQDSQLWTGRLWALRTATGVGFAISVGIVLALLITAFMYSPGHYGLPTFAPANSLGYKTLFSFLPLALSKSIEALMITIGSCYCMLGPYKALHGRNALNFRKVPSSRSLAIDYDKSPPHFQLLRSLRTGDIALASLTMAILVSHVLSVTLPAIFSPLHADLPNYIKVAPRDLKINGAFSEASSSLEMNYVLSASLLNETLMPVWTTPEYYVLPFYPVDYWHNVSTYEGPTTGVGVDIKCNVILKEQAPQNCFGYDGTSNHTPCQVPSYIFDVNDSFDTDYDSALKFADGRFEVICKGQSKYCPSGDLLLKSSNSSNTFFAFWFEMGKSWEHMDAAILKCITQDKVVKLNATFGRDERVSLTSGINPLDLEEVAALYPTSVDSNVTLSSTFVEFVYNGVSQMAVSSAPALTWFNHFMVALNPSIVQKDMNLSHIPDTSLLAETFEDVYRRLFAINAGLYQESLFLNSSEDIMPAIAFIPTDRVNIKELMFIISAVILVFTIVVLILLYLFQGPPLPGHMPTTLMRVYAVLYASNAKEECGQLTGRNPKKRVEELEGLKKEYAYGEYESEDGRKHFGAYRVIEKKLHI